MDTHTILVAVPGGREFCVEVAGEDRAPLVLAHNGTPNSRHLPPQVIGMDRECSAAPAYVAALTGTGP